VRESQIISWRLRLLRTKTGKAEDRIVCDYGAVLTSHAIRELTGNQECPSGIDVTLSDVTRHASTPSTSSCRKLNSASGDTKSYVRFAKNCISEVVNFSTSHLTTPFRLSKYKLKLNPVVRWVTVRNARLDFDRIGTAIFCGQDGRC
jgi:hypothetical protein